MMTNKKGPAQGKSEKDKGVASRKLALQTLLKIEKDGAFSNIVLSSALDKSGMKDRDKAFVTLLVQGVIRNRALIDNRIRPFSKKPIDKIPDVLLNILRMAVFQLDFVEDIPPSAVLHTSTSIARICGHEGLAKYTNGVLRNYLRAKEKTLGQRQNVGDLDLSKEELAEKYSMPIWLVDRWLNHLGFEATVDALVHSSKKPENFIRINRTAITDEGLLSIMKSGGVELTQSSIMDGCYRIVSKPKGKLENLPGYDQGLFSIQDEAAALVSHIVRPETGQTIVDLCAAPGGKTLHLSEIMDSTGRIIAVDKNESRFEQLRLNSKRLDLNNIEIKVGDGRTFSMDDGKKVDIVLVDAPCTGTGVINRKSDIRFNRKPEDLIELPKLQRELLNNAARLVKVGGEIVYSTCSMEPEENELVVNRFVEENSENFRFEDISALLPEVLLECPTLSATAQEGKLFLNPSIHSLSGFFIAKMKKFA